MRHRVAGRKLSRHSQHRKWMFRNMLVSLFDHERLNTTLAKAKELRRWADKMITLGKKGTLHARRRAFALLRNETVVKKLFDDIAPRFKDRPGGYTRIYRMNWRQGDAAPLSLIELVGLAAKEEKKASAVERAKKVIKRVAPKRKEKAAGEKETPPRKEKAKERKEPKEKRATGAKEEAPKKEKKEKGKAEKGKTEKGSGREKKTK